MEDFVLSRFGGKVKASEIVSQELFWGSLC